MIGRARWVLVLLATSACSSSTSSPGNDASPADEWVTDASAREASAVVDASRDVAVVVDAAAPIDGAVMTLNGDITRTTSLEAGQDGKGKLYVAIFDRNPVSDRA